MRAKRAFQFSSWSFVSDLIGSYLLEHGTQTACFAFLPSFLASPPTHALSAPLSAALFLSICVCVCSAALACNLSCDTAAAAVCTFWLLCAAAGKKELSILTGQFMCVAVGGVTKHAWMTGGRTNTCPPMLAYCIAEALTFPRNGC